MTHCTSGDYKEKSSSTLDAGTIIGHSSRLSISRRSSYSSLQIRRNNGKRLCIYTQH